MEITTNEQGQSDDQQQQCHFFFELPAELQLLIMSRLDLHELLGAKLISRPFQALANDDQLWKQLTILAKIPEKILEEARETQRGVGGTCSLKAKKYAGQGQWQHLLKTSTIIMRENAEKAQGAFTQMRIKIDVVREALERQTQLLDETHQRLEQLSGRLHQIEEQNRIRDLERLRAQEREKQRMEDERWIQEWEAMCISEKLGHATEKSSRDSPISKNEIDRGTQKSHRHGAGM